MPETRWRTETLEGVEELHIHCMLPPKHMEGVRKTTPRTYVYVCVFVLLVLCLCCHCRGCGKLDTFGCLCCHCKECVNQYQLSALHVFLLIISLVPHQLQAAQHLSKNARTFPMTPITIRWTFLCMTIALSRDVLSSNSKTGRHKSPRSAKVNTCE